MTRPLPPWAARCAFTGALATLPFACGRTPAATDGATKAQGSSAPSTEASTSLVVPIVTTPQAVHRRRLRALLKDGDINFDATYDLVAHPDAAAAKEINESIDGEIRAEETLAATRKLHSDSVYCSVALPRSELAVVKCELQRNVEGAADNDFETRVRTWLLRDGHAHAMSLAELFVVGSTGVVDVDSACLEDARNKGYPKADGLDELGKLLRYWSPTSLGLEFQFQTGELDDARGTGPTCLVRWPRFASKLLPDGPIAALAQAAPAPSTSASK